MTSVDGLASMGPMTDLNGPGSAERAVAAVAAAEAAALRAGVRIRQLAALDDLEAVYRLYDGIWRPDPKNPPVTTELLRALTKAGNYVAGAFAGDALAGACVGFFGAPAGEVLHSHVAGVAPAALGRGVGFALKLHQRAWALQRGVSRIEWTFDPLVRRNAYFNLAKLGSAPAEYLPNFYGDMNDGINGGGDTDRLLLHWDLTRGRVVAACAGHIQAADAGAELARGAVIGLGRSAADEPAAGTVAGPTVLIAVPPDIETMRRTDPGRAKAWRIAVREVLSAAMAEGRQASGFDRAGWYVVTRPVPAEEGNS